MGCESSTNKISRVLKFNMTQVAGREKKKKKWNTATRGEGQKDRQGCKESKGSSSRNDRGNRERRKKERG